MSARNSCVIVIVSWSARSRDIKSQRASRSSASCSLLQAAICSSAADCCCTNSRSRPRNSAVGLEQRPQVGQSDAHRCTCQLDEALGGCRCRPQNVHGADHAFASNQPHLRAAPFASPSTPPSTLCPSTGSRRIPASRPARAVRSAKADLRGGTSPPRTDAVPAITHQAEDFLRLC